MSRHLYTFGPFELDTTEQVLRREGQRLPLKPKVFELLVVLVENSGRVVCKDELMKQVWGETIVEEGNLAVSIVKLRQALGESHNEGRYIETVPKRGYRFVASVTQGEAKTPRVAAISADISVPGEGDGSGGKGTIAVLPFHFIGTIGDEYLGLGLADALITRISLLRQIPVRPTTSIRKYNGGQDPIAAGKELRVEWVLDGSVQKLDGRIRVTVQLLNVADGVLRWAQKFDEKWTDIFEIEDSISEQVAATLVAKLTGEEKKLLGKRYTENTKAYEAYLKGRYFLEKRSTDGCQRALHYFEEAIEADPNYALAFVGMANCYQTLCTIFPSQQWVPNAERAVMNALRIDDELGEAHASLGCVRCYQWLWSAAEQEFKAAIDLSPNYASAHAGYALYLAEMGQSDEALEEIKKALELDPISLIINSQFGSILYLARRYDEAAQQCRKILEMDPNFAVTRFILGVIYEALGHYEDAQSEYRQSQLSGLENLVEFTASIGRLYAFSGRRVQALRMIDELNRLAESDYVQPTYVAMIYAALGDTDDAFRWLERACAERDPDLCILKVDPRVDRLRDDPRFLSLLQCVGLASSDHHGTPDLLSDRLRLEGSGEPDSV